MSQLEKAYQSFLEKNTTSELTFEEWKEIILSQSDLIKEHKDDIVEIQKMVQELLDKQNK
jgi:LPS O-antigen subunit length determinant protein (WzzB/FepE family)